MPLQNGEAFAGYIIQRFLGSGAMGEVYLVQHPRLPRLDALKVLSAALTDDADFRDRFNREADLAATLWHQHIVGIHDRGEFDGRLWISMDYVDGTDAGQLLHDTYPTGMPVPEVIEIVAAVADALDFAHQRRLLHRDVKPSNILLTGAQSGRRRVLLGDFGIARQADEASGLTGTNMTVGSVGYAAPEQLMGQEIDGRADQYGLAATAYHLLTGTMPFQHSNPAVVISKQLSSPAPLLSESHPALATLDRALSVALAKDPSRRYRRCLDLAEALRRESAGRYSRPAVAPPHATRALSVSRPEHEAAPDATRSMNLPPKPAADHTRATRRPETAPASSEVPADTRKMDLPPSPFRRAATPAENTRAIKKTASEPRVPPAARKSVSAARPLPNASADPTARITGQRPEPREAEETTHLLSAHPQTSAGQPRSRKALPLLAVALGVAAFITAAVAYWKFDATSKPAITTPAASAPNTDANVAVRTKSGRTICLISSGKVRCEAKFTHLPVQTSVSQTGFSDISVDSQAQLEWDEATIGTPPDIEQLEYATYHWLGWTVVAAKDGTRFTNDATGHGMFVSVGKVDGF
jgi:serine/threonine protein kinase